MSDLRPCPDCERLIVIEPDSLCPSCAEFREWKFGRLHDEWQDKLSQRKRLKPFGTMSGADFGEALSDMAKVVERSKG